MITHDLHFNIIYLTLQEITVLYLSAYNQSWPSQGSRRERLAQVIVGWVLALSPASDRKPLSNGSTFRRMRTGDYILSLSALL